jgi:hypothetical protein
MENKAFSRWRGRGRGRGGVSTEHISIFLYSQSQTSNIHIEFELAAANSEPIPTNYKFNRDGYGCASFMDRNAALKHLVKGALVIEVRMRPVKYPPPFIPDNPFARKMAGLYNDEEFADIIFHVGGEKMIKSTTKNHDGKVIDAGRKFFAHRLILNKAAPLLAELSSTEESPSHIELPNMAPDAFKALLLYIYGCEIPKFGEDIELTQEIINAADKYGITNLKLEAEAVYVSSIKITCENVLDNLHHAHSKNCALLKEEVVDFIEENAAEILELGKLKDDAPDISHDVLAVVARKKKMDRSSIEFSTMHISDLRREADRKGLDVDGSREMLVAAIKDDDKGNDDENDGANNSNENGE